MSLQPPSSYLVNFSQNLSLLAVASDTCYSIYSLRDVDSKLHKLYTNNSDKIRIIELFYGASLVAMVTYNSPKRLKLWNYRKGIELSHYSFSSGIVAVRLNRVCIVIVLEDDIHIYTLLTMKIKHTINNTPRNRSGICALSCESKEHGFLAYPGSLTEGIVKIFDTVACKAKITFAAFEAPIAALAFNCSGIEVAVACERGTVISIFSAQDGTNYFKFLRGYTRYATINSLLFSACGNYLISSSNTETVHVFHLKNNESSSISGSGVMGYLAKAVADYLPNDVADVLLQRSYATTKLPKADCKRIGAITMVMGQLRLLIASEDGFLYSFSVSSIAERECLLMRKHNLYLAEMDIMVESSKANDDDDYDVLKMSDNGTAAGRIPAGGAAGGEAGAVADGGVVVGGSAVDGEIGGGTAVSNEVVDLSASTYCIM